MKIVLKVVLGDKDCDNVESVNVLVTAGRGQVPAAIIKAQKSDKKLWAVQVVQVADVDME